MEAAMIPILNIISEKVRHVISGFEVKNAKVKKIILAGGSTNMPGFLNYFKTNFQGLDVKTGNAFERIFYPNELKPLVPEISTTFSIALGEALKNFEE
jgi:molecular chaperone DnaK (HSP70)